jgi:hypothetical protein
VKVWRRWSARGPLFQRGAKAAHRQQLVLEAALATG